MNNTLNKINEHLDILEKQEQISEARKVGGSEYDKFFNSMLKKWKVKSYKDIPKNKQAKFFDEIDKQWNAKGEK